MKTEKLRTETDDRFARLEERLEALEELVTNDSVITPAQAEEHLQRLRDQWGKTDEEMMALATAGLAHGADHHLWLILLGRGDLIGQRPDLPEWAPSRDGAPCRHCAAPNDEPHEPTCGFVRYARQALRDSASANGWDSATFRHYDLTPRQKTQPNDDPCQHERTYGDPEYGTTFCDGCHAHICPDCRCRLPERGRERRCAKCERKPGPGLGDLPDGEAEGGYCGIPIPVKPSAEPPGLTCDVRLSPPGLRATPTIEEAIRWSETRSSTHTVTVLYEPGNGSRYMLRLDRSLCSPRVAEELGISGYCYVLVTDLLQGTTMVAQTAPDAVRVATGLRRSPVDGQVLAELIAHLLSGLDKPKGSRHG
jgi:hypothetical protein